MEFSEMLALFAVLAGCLGAIYGFIVWWVGPMLRQTVRKEIKETVNGKIDAVDKKVDQKFDSMDGKVDSMGFAIARIEGRWEEQGRKSA